METTALTTEYRSSPSKHEVTGMTQPLSTVTPPNERNHLARNSSEKAKVALKCQPPYLEFSVHALALAIIAGLLYVNIAQYFWKDFSIRKQERRNVELKAWQYGAKVHGLLMVSSLSFIVFSYMRKLLVGRRGIGFGLISAPHTLGAPSTLTKKKFWVGFTRNPAFGLLLVVASVLSIVLEPSSAITMIPSLAWSDMSNALSDNSSTIYYTSAREVIWPTRVDISSSGLNSTEVATCLDNPFSPKGLYCPTAGYMDMLKWFASFMSSGARNDLLFTDLFGGVQREVSIAADPSNGEGIEAYATVVSELISRSLGPYFNYAKRNKIGAVEDVAYPRLSIKSDTPVYQPVVYTKCTMTFLSDRQQFEGVTNGSFSFPTVRHSWIDTRPVLDTTSYIQANHTIFHKLPSERPRFMWVKSPRENITSSLLAIAVVPMMARNSTVSSYQSSAIVTCAVDARWAASDAYYQPMNSSTISSNVSDTLMPFLTDTKYHARPKSLQATFAFSNKPLDIDLNWAALLNGNYLRSAASSNPTNTTSTTTNTSAIEAFLDMPVSRLDNADNTTAAFRVPNITTKNQKGAVEEYVSLLLSTVLTDALSRNAQPVYPVHVTSIKDGVGLAVLLQGFLMQGTTFRTNMTDLPYSIRVSLARYGYGYGIRNATTWVAVAVLLVYALVVLVHVGVVVSRLVAGTYEGGDSWEDVAELVALAVNSTPCEGLVGTGAGVERSGTWRHVVRVREVGRGHLGLLFGDRGWEEGRMVEVGKKYL